MPYGASQKNIGKYCYLKNVQLALSPFFPAYAPFRIVGAMDDAYLLEGPWTDQVQWQASHRQVVIVEDDRNMGENRMIALE